MDLWSDGSATTTTQPRTVWAIGLLATLGLLFIAAVGLLFSALLARIRRSDRDARSDSLADLHNRRRGGDEFVVLSETTTDPVAAGEDLAGRLMAALEDPVALPTGSFRVSASVGIATAVSADDFGSDELMRQADVALGRCKAAPRTGFVVYDERLKDAELDQLQLDTDLQTALDTADLVVHFQPVVDASAEPVSFEALVRWNRDGQMMAPDAFLGLAAEMGRMPDLDRIVLDKALAALASAHEAGQSDTTMHVNADAASLQDPDFPAIVKHLLDQHGVAAEQLHGSSSPG